jgi:hypothetical protein
MSKNSKVKTSGQTGPIETGPIETGPIETGPIETGPIETGSIETGTLSRNHDNRVTRVFAPRNILIDRRCRLKQRSSISWLRARIFKPWAALKP